MALEAMSNMFTGNPLIEKATVDNEQPTPGYMYNDISKITFQGSKACERLRDQLLYKLKLKSPAVKIKTLLVLKHLLEHGNPHFQQLLQQYADDIKPCLDFRGPPDPLRGDAPYRLVRDKAQQVMNVLYETRAPAPFEQPSTSVLAPAGGQAGASPALGSLGGTGLGPRGPTAISGGSPMPEKKSTVSEIFGTARDAIFGKSTPPSASGFGQAGTGSGNLTGSGNKFVPPGGGAYPVGGRAFFSGASYVNPNERFDNNISLDKATGGWFPDDNEDGTGNSAATSTPEGQIVESLCNPPPNATAAQPTRQNLSDFVKKAQQAQNPDLVCYLLASQCSDPNWKKRLRALHGIHELLLISFPSALSYFSSQDGVGAIVPLTSSVQALLKTKAQQIIDLVTPYINNNPNPNNNGNGNVSTGNQAGGLFDGTDVASTGSLFGDLQISATSGATGSTGAAPSGGESDWNFLDDHPVTPPVTDTPTPLSPIHTPVMNTPPVALHTPPTQPQPQPQPPPQQPSANAQLLGINLNATGIPGSALSGAGIQALYYQSNPVLLQQQQMLAMGMVHAPYYGVGAGVGTGVGGIGPIQVGVGFGGVATTGSGGGGFEFVDSPAAKPEDPFSFVKIGQ